MKNGFHIRLFAFCPVEAQIIVKHLECGEFSHIIIVEYLIYYFNNFTLLITKLKTKLKTILLRTVVVLSAAALTACVTADGSSVQLVSNDTVDTGNTPLCQASSHDIEAVKSLSYRKVAFRPDDGAADRPVKKLDPQAITLLNWNIYKGNEAGWQNDLSRFARDHNLMTIQEAHLDESLLSILQNNDFEWVMNAAFHLDNMPAGVMNLANVRPVHSCGFTTQEPIIRVPKSALVSYYAIEGYDKHLLVANIHGINFTLGMQAYRKQLNQLHEAIEHHDGPMIVAGDFNSWSEERFTEIDKMLHDLSLSSLSYKVNNKTHFLGNALDHVFFRGLEPVSNTVYEVSSSDHNPISVSFRLRS